MALTGLQIFKLLPQTNCKDCGYPTCLAFAMKLAAKQVALDLCPHASDEAKSALGEASAPPIRKIVVGRNEQRLELGEEVVLYRHEKTFYHPTALALGVRDDLAEAEFEQAVRTITAASYDRAGETISTNMIALLDRSGDGARYAARARQAAELSTLPLALVSDDPARVSAAARAAGDHAGMIHAATPESLAAFAPVAREHKLPLVLKADDLEALAALAETAQGMGLEDLLLDPGYPGQAEALRRHTLIRRAALERKAKGFGYPSVLAVPEGSGPLAGALAASLGVAKYAAVTLIPEWHPSLFLPLLTLRQNIYTDPQKPLQVEAGIYSVGEPNENSPVYVTTNFSLTYFMLSTEIDGSGQPGWMVVVDAEGMSVLTAWSAGKFGGAQVGKFVAGSGIADKVAHRKVIIPGYVAVIQGEMEDALPGWEVLVGPQEAADVPAYVKDVWLPAVGSGV
ncbi:MAG: acetyl-CoA decarbonylase/synthase complex subunit gamma [Candidatus Zixiibacteriota bacterium]|nr:MAG: acetyl-CoA decarbonylase/synthase complex subunit gamma [candidate division Zixibacteria bacterium]